MKILIVDDDADARLLLTRLLPRAGYRDFVTVGSAAEAYRALGLDGPEPNREIGLILLDIHMPDEDGVRVCRRIKDDGRFEDVAVVMVTVDGQPDVLSAAYAAGAIDYITKPYDGHELLLRIRSAERLVTSLRALRAERDMVNAVLETSGALMVVLDEEGRIVRFNRTCEEITGYAAAEARGRRVWEFLLPDEEVEAVRCVFHDLRAGRFPNHFENHWVARDGSRRYIAWSNTAVLDDHGRVRLVVATGIDITERKAMEAELRFSSKLVEASANGIMATDPDGVIRTVNPAFTRITGYTLEEVRGKTPGILQSGHHDPEFYAAMWRRLKKEGEWHGEVWNRRKDGTVYPEWLTISAIYDDKGRVERYMAVFLDITEHKEVEARLKYMAGHDPLTGLPNRQLFDDRLEHALARARRDGHGLAVLFLDLDGFKPINDEMGHHAGDQVLREVAARLERLVRTSDTVARMGGDEFVVLLDEITEADRKAVAAMVAEKVLVHLPEPIIVNERTVLVGTSIGIALHPEHGTAPDALVSAADTAMYQAKQEGRMRYCFFDAGGCTRTVD